MVAKIMINAKNEQQEDVILFLDKDVSFEFQETKNSKKTIFYISSLNGMFSIDSECSEILNDIEQQIEEIIADKIRVEEETLGSVREIRRSRDV